MVKSLPQGHQLVLGRARERTQGSGARVSALTHSPSSTVPLRVASCGTRGVCLSGTFCFSGTSHPSASPAIYALSFKISLFLAPPLRARGKEGSQHGVLNQTQSAEGILGGWGPRLCLRLWP